jgi:RimJ/RimL family protein N-acetyltransferase
MLVEYLKNNLKVNKIMAYCDNENTASMNIMNKLGMKREGLLVRHFRINNKWRDEGIFSIIVQSDVD